jgi:hypothetical protein
MYWTPLRSTHAHTITSAATPTYRATFFCFTSHFEDDDKNVRRNFGTASTHEEATPRKAEITYLIQAVGTDSELISLRWNFL